MRNVILLLILLISQLPIFAQTRIAEDYYVAAFNEMSDMLTGRDSLSIKRAVNEGGGGVTTHIKNGSHSLIILGGKHPNGRAVTTGHEILGHGRSWAAGLGEDFQHVEAIRTENLILRVMGIPFINTGENHGNRTPVSEPTLLPAFR